MAVASPFLDAERAAGATIQTYGGLELPEKFVDPMAEYEAARAAAGLFDLSFRGSLRFTGSDRTSFLQNMLSADIRALRPGGSCYTAILTQQSKVVADGKVSCFDDSLLLDVDLRFKDRVREHLEKFLVADEVEIEDQSEAETTLGIHGPRAGAVLQAALEGQDLPEAEQEHRSARIGDQSLRIAWSNWTGDKGFDVSIPRQSAAAIWGVVAKAGLPFGLRPIGMVAFNVLRVEAGIPWMGVDFDESSLVLEAGLDRAISFTKGCYLGQETVERTHSRGHVNRKLVGLRFDGRMVPRAGAKVAQDGSEVGRVTSAVFSPAVGSAIGMGYVRREVMNPGSRLQVELPSGTITAEVVAMPFFRRS